MSEKVENNEELDEIHLTKGLLFTAIVLFPLVPFALIYRNRKLSKKVRGILIVVWFVFLTAVYQWACVSQGPVVKSISVPVSTLTTKVGTTKKIDYTIKPQTSQLKIKKIKFSSSDRSKAVVDDQGVVKTTSPGKATITITVQDNHYQERVKKVKLLIVQ